MKKSRFFCLLIFCAFFWCLNSSVVEAKTQQTPLDSLKADALATLSPLIETAKVYGSLPGELVNTWKKFFTSSTNSKVNIPAVVMSPQVPVKQVIQLPVIPKPVVKKVSSPPVIEKEGLANKLNSQVQIDPLTKEQLELRLKELDLDARFLALQNIIGLLNRPASLSNTIITSPTITNGSYTGTFSGSFSGDGSALTGIASGGSFSTSSVRLVLSASSPLAYDDATGAFSVESGYLIPLTASSTNWNTFYETPSSRISVGSGLYWSGNTLNATSTGGTVTSIGLTAPTGLSVSGSPITTSGTLNLSLTSGYEIPLIASTTAWEAKTSSQWTTLNSNIYYAGGSVGVGTTTPITKFAVVGTAGINPFSVASSTGSTLFMIDQSGNVGVGTASPYATPFQILNGTYEHQLSLSGTLNASGETAGLEFKYNGGGLNTNIARILGYTQSGGGGDLLFQTSSTGGGAYGTKVIFTRAGDVGVGTTTPTTKLAVVGSAGSNPFSVASSTGANMLTLTSGGLLGLGVTTPSSAAFEVYNTTPTYQARFYGKTSFGSAQSGLNDAQISIGGGSSASIAGAIGYDGTVGRDLYIANLDGASTVGRDIIFLSGGGEIMRMVGGGTVGIGTTTPASRLSVVGVAGTNPFQVASSTGADLLMVNRNGNIGVASSTPGFKLTVAGTVGFDGLAASGGADQNVCINPTTKEITYGAACAASSERFKQDIVEYTKGLEDLNKLRPVSFKYREGDNTLHLGFIAEEVEKIDPALIYYEVASTTPKGIKYNEMFALVVNSIQELRTKVENVGDDIFAALADKVVSVKELIVKTLRIDGDVCVDDVCATKEQFKELLRKAGAENTVRTVAPVVPMTPMVEPSVPDASSTIEILPPEPIEPTVTLPPENTPPSESVVNTETEAPTQAEPEQAVE